MVDQTDHTKSIYAALAKAQSEFKTPVKNKKVAYSGRDFWYADLQSVLDAVNPSLNANGFCLFERLVVHESGGFGLSTVLAHSSGATIDSWYPLPDPTKVKDQDFGKSLTYARRYSVSALLNVASEDDTDGADNKTPAGAKASTTQKPPAKPPQKPANQAPQGPTQAMLKCLYAIGKGMQWPADAIRVYSVAKTNRTPGQLSKAQYDQLCKFLEGAPYDEAQVAEIENMYASLTDEQIKRVDGEEAKNA